MCFFLRKIKVTAILDAEGIYSHSIFLNILICNGVCKKYKGKKLFQQSWYFNGNKRCSNCAIFLMCEGIRCPCCNSQLKTKPNNSKHKVLLKFNSNDTP